jgi:hypothetical protein
VIQVIRGAGLITNPPSDIGFLTMFFDKAMAMLAAQQGGRLRVPIPAPTPGVEAGAAAASADDASEDPLGPDSPAAVSGGAPEASQAPSPENPG